jgi:hypothetical protein
MCIYAAAKVNITVNDCSMELSQAEQSILTVYARPTTTRQLTFHEEINAENQNEYSKNKSKMCQR